MPLTPDLDGFREAQDRLRAQMGTPVVFHVPQTPAWPSGTPLDPETDRPYDPTVEPESGGGHDDVTKTVSVLWNPIRIGRDQDPLGDDVRGGARSSLNMILAVSMEDYDDIQDADSFTRNDQEYTITTAEMDPGPDERWLVWGEAR